MSDGEIEIYEHFDSLPDHIIEKIVENVPLRDVGLNVSCVNSFFLEVSNKVVRSKFFKLVKMLDETLKDLKTEIDLLPPADRGKIPPLRSYFVMEILRSDMHLLKSVCKTVLYYGEKIYSIWELVDEYYTVYESVSDILVFTLVILY